jgi:hypothetical protein
MDPGSKKGLTSEIVVYFFQRLESSVIFVCFGLKAFSETVREAVEKCVLIFYKKINNTLSTRIYVSYSASRICSSLLQR